jgi:hypothetical protein
MGLPLKLKGWRQGGKRVGHCSTFESVPKARTECQYRRLMTPQVSVYCAVLADIAELCLASNFTLFKRFNGPSSRK